MGRCLDLIARCSPPRDALTLFLEALQLREEGEEAALVSQLLAGTHALLLRQPRRGFEAALNALPQVQAAAAELVAEEPAVRSAIAVAGLLAAAPPGKARCSSRALLRLLGTLRGCGTELLQPLHASLAAVGVSDWASLCRAALPLAGGASDDDESDGEEEEAAPWLGAGALGLAWLGEDSSRGNPLSGASPLALHLLCCESGAMRSTGCRLAAALARRLQLAGACGDEGGLGALTGALCAVLSHPGGADAAALGEAHAALLSLLDAATPWTRLRLLRVHLQPPGPASMPAGAVEALLFARLKQETLRGWGGLPFGGPPAAQITLAWLRACAERAVDDDAWLVCSADAVVGALNALRYSLLRSRSEPLADATALRTPPEALQLLVRDTLILIANAAERIARSAEAEEDVGRMLALQTVCEVARACTEAAV